IASTAASEASDLDAKNGGSSAGPAAEVSSLGQGQVGCFTSSGRLFGFDFHGGTDLGGAEEERGDSGAAGERHPAAALVAGSPLCGAKTQGIRSDAARGSGPSRYFGCSSIAR